MTSASRSKGEDVAAIAAGLTEPQKAIVMFIGDDVKPAFGVESINGQWLFEHGIISQIQAAGYGFTNLTELGLAVRRHLTDQEGQNQ